MFRSISPTGLGVDVGSAASCYMAAFPTGDMGLKLLGSKPIPVISSVLCISEFESELCV